MEKTEKRKLFVNILITILLGLITFNGVIHHEVWADEAQVWLLVKNLSVGSLMAHLPNEGHPPLFYFLIMPFAKMGFSIMAMKLICWAVSVVGCFLILQYSPFNKFAKLSIVLSAGYLYFFSVIARSYSLFALLIPLLCIVYPHRKSRPFLYAVIISMIACTHIIMFAFCGVLALYFLWEMILKCWRTSSYEERKKYILSFSIIVLSMLFVASLLIGTPGNNAAIVFKLKDLSKSIMLVVPQFFINLVDYTVTKTFAIYAPTLVGVILFVGFTLFSMVQLFLRNKKIFFLVFVSVLFQLIIYVLWYRAFIYPTRIAVAYLILMFGIWVVLADDESKSKYKFSNDFWVNFSIGMIFLLTVFNGARYMVTDLFYNYSASKPTAEFIQKNLPSDSIIAVTNDPFSLGLYYYLPKGRLWSILQEKKIDYVVWDSSLEKIYMKKNWSRIVKRQFSKELETKPVYVVFTIYSDYAKNEIFPAEDFKAIYKSPPSIADGERYIIYQFVKK